MEDDLDGLRDDELYVLLDEVPDAEAGPRPSPAALAATLTALRPGRRTLVRAGTLLTVAATAAGISAAATAWWDAHAARAAKADTVALRLDSVTDGPAASAGAETTATAAGSGGTAPATAEYVLEIADDGPAAVTVTDARADARPAFATVAWHAVGPATIPAGGTGRFAVDVELDCGGLPDSGGADAGALFPDPQVTVLTSNGAKHTVVLAAEAPAATTADPRDSPRIVAPLRNPCRAGAAPAAVVGVAPRFNPPLVTVGPSLTHVTLAYDGVSAPAAGPLGPFGLDFTATDLDAQAVTIDTRLFGAIPITVTDTSGRVTVEPSAPVRFRVTVKLGFCDASTADPAAVLATPAFVVDFGSGETEALPLSAMVTDPRLRLAGDIAAQVEKVCP